MITAGPHRGSRSPPGRGRPGAGHGPAGRTQPGGSARTRQGQRSGSATAATRSPTARSGRAVKILVPAARRPRGRSGAWPGSGARATVKYQPAVAVKPAAAIR